jgi:uncharacterized protein (TIGR02145 family)
MKKLFYFFILFQLNLSCFSDDSDNTENVNNPTNYSFTNGPVMNYGNLSSPTIITSCGQTWMKENIRATKYKNGDQIQYVTDPTAWAGLTTGAYCEYSTGGSVYGYLYNWYAVNDPRGLAPNGWHIPSIQELENYVNCLGGYLVAGEKMKEVGVSHWNDPNYASNISGFTARGGGLRSSTGNFVNIKQYGILWSSTEYSADRANACRLNSNTNYVYFDNSDKNTGYSIRFVKN